MFSKNHFKVENIRFSQEIINASLHLAGSSMQKAFALMPLLIPAL